MLMIHAIGFLTRTPTPPPFLGNNSIPARLNCGDDTADIIVDGHVSRKCKVVLLEGITMAW